MGNHRATDGARTGRVWVWLRRFDWLMRLIIPVFAIAVAGYAVHNVEQQNTKLSLQARATTRESVERRDQNCIVFERAAITTVNNFHDTQRQLKGTITFLANSPQEDRSSFLNQAIRASLPQLRDTVKQRWDEARASKAPPYCEKSGVGLPGSSPKLPPRPGRAQSSGTPRFPGPH